MALAMYSGDASIFSFLVSGLPRLRSFFAGEAFSTSPLACGSLLFFIDRFCPCLWFIPPFLRELHNSSEPDSGYIVVDHVAPSNVLVLKSFQSQFVGLDNCCRGRTAGSDCRDVVQCRPCDLGVVMVDRLGSVHRQNSLPHPSCRTSRTSLEARTSYIVSGHSCAGRFLNLRYFCLRNGTASSPSSVLTGNSDVKCICRSAECRNTSLFLFAAPCVFRSCQAFLFQSVQYNFFRLAPKIDA